MAGTIICSEKKLFKEKLADIFLLYPPIYLYIFNIIERAVTLQSDRNLLLHGRLAACARPFGATTIPSILAYGRRKGVTVSKEFNEQQLNELFSDIAHIAGMMELFSIPKSHSIQFYYACIPRIAWTEILHLQAFLSNNHPVHTSGPMPEAPPGAFRA
jgi:hypothetical protein